MLAVNRKAFIFAFIFIFVIFSGCSVNNNENIPQDNAVNNTINKSEDAVSIRTNNTDDLPDFDDFSFTKIGIKEESIIELMGEPSFRGSGLPSLGYDLSYDNSILFVINFNESSGYVGTMWLLDSNKNRYVYMPEA